MTRGAAAGGGARRLPCGSCERLFDPASGGTCNGTVTTGCGQTPPAVPAGGNPAGLVLDPRHHTLYIADNGFGPVSFFRFQAPWPGLPDLAAPLPRRAAHHLPHRPNTGLPHLPRPDHPLHQRAAVHHHHRPYPQTEIHVQGQSRRRRRHRPSLRALQPHQTIGRFGTLALAAAKQRPPAACLAASPLATIISDSRPGETLPRTGPHQPGPPRKRVRSVS